MAITNDDGYVVTKDAEVRRFELRHNGELLSYADFTERAGVITVPHVATRPEHRGQGNAGRLMDGVLRQIRMSGGRITPLCPFAAAHIRDNPEWQNLLAIAA